VETREQQRSQRERPTYGPPIPRASTSRDARTSRAHGRWLHKAEGARCGLSSPTDVSLNLQPTRLITAQSHRTEIGANLCVPALRFHGTAALSHQSQSTPMCARPMCTQHNDARTHTRSTCVRTRYVRPRYVRPASQARLPPTPTASYQIVCSDSPLASIWVLHVCLRSSSSSLEFVSAASSWSSNLCMRAQT